LSLKTGWRDHQILLTPDRVYRNQNNEKPTRVGLAAPPLKTPKGWLTFFHARFGQSWSTNSYYNIGFMVLDLENPTKINYLHSEPILWPEKPEEKYGCIPNVCFVCAAVDYKNFIYVYWGGADTVICGGFLKKSELSMCY